MSITPTGDYARYTDKTPVRPMTATLIRSQGSWWLQWEDTKETDLHHSSGPTNGWSKDDMVQLVTGAK